MTCTSFEKSGDIVTEVRVEYDPESQGKKPPKVSFHLCDWAERFSLPLQFSSVLPSYSKARYTFWKSLAPPVLPNFGFNSALVADLT